MSRSSIMNRGSLCPYSSSP